MNDNLRPFEALKAHIGTTIAATDVVTAGSVARFAATLDLDDPAPEQGDPLPPGWHGAYFLRDERPAALAPDGLPLGAAPLPEVPLPRRMFGGARITFHQPIRVGEEIHRETELTSIEPKSGRSGILVFATLQHRISGPRGLAIVEEQDIIHLGAADPSTPPPPPKPAPSQAAWRQDFEPDPILLFRYSALTFNSHRIHYDRDYAVDQERYPGLLVQGTLLATLVLELCRRHSPARPVARFAYRSVRPVFDTESFAVAGDPTADGATAALWVQDHEGALALSAEAHFAT